MRKHLLLKITAICLFIVMLLSFAACSLGGSSSGGGGGGGDTPGGGNGGGTKTGESLTPKSITQLKDLVNYSAKKTDYEPAGKTYSASAQTYDGQDCKDQIRKLQNRIDKKTEDVWMGETDSAVTKIFTKSTPDGILTAIAKAALTFEEMERVVDYIAGEEDADIGAFVEETDNGWIGTLTTTSSRLTEWLDAGKNGKDLNEGWSFFDDWDLYDRLKDYSKSSTNKLSKGSDKKLNDIGTQEISEDNASWQYRSILEKIYKPAKDGGVDLPGAAAARLATYMLEYAIDITESAEMSGSSLSIADAYTAYEAAGKGDKNTAPYSIYFRTPVELKKFPSVEAAQNDHSWNPYAGLGDYDVLVYLLSFYEYYKVPGGGYNNLPGLQSCVLLYGYYYQYNQTYYKVVLANRETYKKQLKYEKLDTFTDTQWLDYVSIQRTNYQGSYRYSDAFYRTFYKVHFDFQESKENFENCVYVIEDLTGHKYTEEMQKAIEVSKKGVEGQLAMSDWMWCYGASETNMKSYNKANTGYQEGKISNIKEKEYEGRFWYEFEELKIIDYLFKKMTPTELGGALYYNCYAYSGSLISQIQNYEKDYVLITDKIETWDKYTSIPDTAAIQKEHEEKYAKEKIKVLQGQAYDDWKNTEVETRAGSAHSQQWGLMSDEIEAARKFDYDSVKSDDQEKGDWQVKCECLEDRVVARTYSCCGQRISEAVTANCRTQHGINYDGVTAVTKDYSADCQISQFVNTYESILLYVATKAKVKFEKPSQGYKTSLTDEVTYTVGYYGTLPSLVVDPSTGKAPATTTQMMTYAKPMKEITMKMGASFSDEVEGDDLDWWNANKQGSTKTNFAAETSTENTSSNGSTTYEYSYKFKGWFLDDQCKFEFNPDDDVDFTIVVYAGYDVTKTKQ